MKITLRRITAALILGSFFASPAAGMVQGNTGKASPRQATRVNSNDNTPLVRLALLSSSFSDGLRNAP